MKINLSRRNFLKALTLTTASFAINAAPKSGKTLKANGNLDSYDVVEKLAQTYFTPISTSEVENWLATYRTLTYEQMELFNERLGGYALELVDKQETDALSRVEFAKQLRREMNAQSLKLYGLPFNQISSETVKSLAEEVWQSGYAQQAHEQFSPENSCVCVNYSYVTTPGGASTWFNSSGRQRRANSPFCSDCDLEILFPKFKSVLKWVSMAGLEYYTWQSGHLIFRNTLTNTNVLIGYNAVMTIFLGIEYAAQIAYRLD